MTRSTVYLATAALLWFGSDLLAAEPCASTVRASLRCTRCAYLPCGCPDDYCPKPLPCVPCLKLGGVADDYCPKPWPCIPCWRPCGVADDYCTKPLPCLPCPAPGGCAGDHAAGLSDQKGSADCRAVSAAREKPNPLRPR
jgi:hypothetical protein